MSIKYEACARGEKYTTADGQEKQRWLKCGVVLETKSGLSLKLESLPVNFDGWLSFFEPKPREEQQRPQQRRQFAGSYQEDVPF
jgi:paraquat-inducible protein B